MPVSPTYPGVYIQELPSGVRTITGVPTSIAAFVGSAARGPLDEPRRIASWADFERVYGGLTRDDMMSYAVYHFYRNGGSEAVIVRIANGATAATITLPGGVTLEARYEGAWGANLRARVDYATRDPLDTTLYNLTIRDTKTGAEERYLNVSTDTASARSLDNVLKQSSLVRATGGQDQRPTDHAPVDRGKDPFADPPPATDSPPADAAVDRYTQATGGGDGSALTSGQYRGDADAKTGMHALLKTDIFNMLCVPPISRDTDVDVDVLSAAAQFCVERRALLVVDAPAAWGNLQTAIDGRDAFVGAFGDAGRNAAIYFPRIRLADPELDNQIFDFAPSGAVAGVMARTDVQRGVWKAPAGTEASLNSVRDLAVKLTDLENGQLNPIAVNCLRILPIFGPVVWGARTLRGADALASDHKYVPVRRLTLFIEESLYRGLKWVVFEPNDEPLWSQIRLNAGAFMQNLFRQGAFQGRSAREAYFVKCDKETTTQNDINLGIVNVIVGFAPLKPAEFVIVSIQQMAGQVQA